MILEEIYKYYYNPFEGDYSTIELREYLKSDQLTWHIPHEGLPEPHAVG
jgi:hypothetical protein